MKTQLNASGINKKDVIELNKDLSLNEIENGLVKLYVDSLDLNLENNNFLLSKYQSADSEVRDTILDHLNISEDELNLEKMIRVFELSVPENDRELNGIYYTPSKITDFMVSDLIQDEGRVCDYACGSGAFLIEAAEYLVENFDLSVEEVLENKIYGMDILEYNIRKSKTLLSLYALREGYDEELDLNLEQEDSLETEWSNKFPEVFEEGGFDYVISNPPYVKIQNLENTTKEQLKENYEVVFKGNFNIFIPFFELAIDITNSKGETSIITPLNYFTTLTGRELREYLQENKYVSKIIDFDKLILFEDVKIYTAITKLNKKRKSTLDYAIVSEKGALDSLSDIENISIKYSSLDSEKWRLLDSNDYENIDKIENKGTRLDDLADIRVGIATLKDSAFIVDGATEKDGYLEKEFKGRTYKIEKEITRPLRKISDLENEDHIKDYSKRIICPYKLEIEKEKRLDGTEEREVESNLIPEEEMSQKYPKTYEYLKDAEETLNSRENGKADYKIWYAYGREQGLSLYGERLYIPTYSKGPKFMLDTNRKALFSNGYAVFPKPHRDTEVVQRVLNSKIMDYYMRKTSKDIERDYQCYQKNFIRRFSVPEFTEDEKNRIKNMDDEELDEFLIQKYGVNLS